MINGIPVVFKLYCKTLLLILRWDTGKGQVCRYGYRLRMGQQSNYLCKYNKLITAVNIHGFVLYFYKKNCINTIRALHIMINLNVTTSN